MTSVCGRPLLMSFGSCNPSGILLCCNVCHAFFVVCNLFLSVSNLNCRLSFLLSFPPSHVFVLRLPSLQSTWLLQRSEGGRWSLRDDVLLESAGKSEDTPRASHSASEGAAGLEILLASDPVVRSRQCVREAAVGDARSGGRGW